MFGVVTLLCAVAAVTFCAGARDRKSIFATAISYCVAILLFTPSSLLSSMTVAVQPAQLAVLLAMAAFYGLLRSDRRTALMVFGGVAAGYWTTALFAQGVPLAFAIMLPVLLSLFSAGRALRRSDFAPTHVRDEALLILLVFATGLAIVPTVMEAWGSAAIFQGTAVTYDSLGTALLVLSIGGLFFVLGALYQWWFLRRWNAKR